MITIQGAIEGISLNGTETLLDNDGKVMLFASEEQAKQFLIEHGYPEADIEDNIIFQEEEEMRQTHVTAPLDEYEVPKHKFPDEVPEDDIDVLVFGVNPEHGHSFREIEFWQDGEWHGDEPEGITHWAYLPKHPA